jgi:hypothetical protein
MGKDLVNAVQVQAVFVFKLKTGSPKLLRVLLCCPREKSNHAFTNPVPFSDTFCDPVKPEHKILGSLADLAVKIQP